MNRIWSCLCQSLGFPGGSDGKEFVCNTVDPDLTPGSGRSHEEGNGYPLQYSFIYTDYIYRFYIYIEREIIYIDRYIDVGMDDIDFYLVLPFLC